jgi:hypothetical protein
MGLFGNDYEERMKLIEDKIIQLEKDIEASYSEIKEDIKGLKPSSKVPQDHTEKITDLNQRLETIEKRLMIGGWAAK